MDSALSAAAAAAAIAVLNELRARARARAADIEREQFRKRLLDATTTARLAHRRKTDDQ